MSRLNLFAAAFALAIVFAMLQAAGAAAPVGQRPYEMIWAGRTQDTHPALLDFENLEGWTVQARDAVAKYVRSRRQQLWGDYVGELVYHGTGARPVIMLKPPRPVALPAGFDCLNLWVYGNNWSWAPNKNTPPVGIGLVLSNGKTQLRIALGQVRWQEWWVMHHRLTADQLKTLGEHPVLEGIEISGATNTADRTLWFDNLSAYKEVLAPLTFEPRPQRNLTLFDGQSPGTNTGPGSLPFPTREQTILPDNLFTDYQTSLEEGAGEFTFHYRGPDGHLTYRYRPAAGDLGDLRAQWEGGGEPFQPLAGGGVYFAPLATGGKALAPEKLAPVACRRDRDSVVATWRATLGACTAEVTYRFTLLQKSLVVDVTCKGGEVGEFRVGHAIGAASPRLVTLPFLTGDSQRPAVLVMGSAEHPLFAFPLIDYYRSNGSELWAENRVSAEGAWQNGGSRYLPKTDGRRNDCFERLFLTVSPRLEEVLPNIPNPKSPWMAVAGERVWRAHGASDRTKDYAQWQKVARYGMTKVAITDHETGWRDGGESFTFRTKAAQGRGGDASQADYARKLHALGFRYGIYNNYTDFAPVNEFWNEDIVTRLPDGEWKTAWARCYNPKPARAVEYEARLAPQIQEKFQLDTAYCDVHTAVRPWQYCDYDARVPGAATFAAVFYAYGEIMLHQKKTWNGPVYSEGNNHWYYCGLTDGNYGQDQAAHLDERPWLVDFDLRKLHPLCCNFGMGNLGMFYGREGSLGATPAEREARLDRFLAATLAFGHTGFLVTEGGMENTVRSYFTVQQVHAHYAQETAKSIQYADANGKLLDASAAVAGGAYTRSQVLTEYSNGLRVAANGSTDQAWAVEGMTLPPNGWVARGELKDGKLLAFSALVDGQRADYVDSPAYLYADGRGRFTRFEKAASDGAMIAHKREGGALEVIPVGKCKEFGVEVKGGAARAVALDEAGKELGAAETRVSRGLVYVTPKAGAFSYILTPAAAAGSELACSRRDVTPGEAVTIQGQSAHQFRVPSDAKPGVRLWQTFEGGWIDFTVRPLVGAALAAEEGKLQLELTSNLAATAEATVSLAGQTRQVRLNPAAPVRLKFPWAPPGEGSLPAELLVSAAGQSFRQTWWLNSVKSTLPLLDFPAELEFGQCLRDQKEKPLDEVTYAIAQWSQRTCGGVARKSLFMHPPYRTRVGYTYAITPPLKLPASPAARLACEVGKQDGSDTGDGILFRLALIDAAGKESALAEKQWSTHGWTPLTADLARWAGQTVRLKLIADVGPRNNTSGDWACWSLLRIESRDPVLVTTVHDQPVKK